MSSRRRAPKTTVIFYHMIGCPHCDATRPAWEKAKKKMKGKGIEVEEREASKVTPAEEVQTFPTFVVKDEDGKVVRKEPGAVTTAGAIMTKLGLDGGGSRRRRTHRRTRKLRHRTLRNYKSFA